MSAKLRNFKSFAFYWIHKPSKSYKSSIYYTVRFSISNNRISVCAAPYIVSQLLLWPLHVWVCDPQQRAAELGSTQSSVHPSRFLLSNIPETNTTKYICYEYRQQLIILFIYDTIEPLRLHQTTRNRSFQRTANLEKGLSLRTHIYTVGNVEAKALRIVCTNQITLGWAV